MRDSNKLWDLKLLSRIRRALRERQARDRGGNSLNQGLEGVSHKFAKGWTQLTKTRGVGRTDRITKSRNLGRPLIAVRRQEGVLNEGVMSFTCSFKNTY